MGLIGGPWLWIPVLFAVIVGGTCWLLDQEMQRTFAAKPPPRRGQSPANLKFVTPREPPYDWAKDMIYDWEVELDGPDRPELFKIFVNDAFTMIDKREILFTSPADHAQAAENTDPFYHERGFVPFHVRQGKLVGEFCTDRVLSETREWGEEPFLAYLIYWTLRMKVRLTKQGDLAALDAHRSPIVEEMVESEMVNMGLWRWWEPYIDTESEDTHWD